MLYAGTAEGDEAGTSIDAAGTRLVIGVPEPGTATTPAGDGRVATLSWNGTGWIADAAELVDDDSEAAARFGFSVATAGDLLAVGAPQRNVGITPNAGSVSVFQRVGGAWVFRQRLVQTVGIDVTDGTDEVLDPPGEFDARFGTAIDLWRDPATDDYRLIVGAPFAAMTGVQVPLTNPPITTSGRAFIYEASGADPTSWSLAGTPRFTDVYGDDGKFLPGGEQIGQSVAIHGDFAVVGSPRLDLASGTLDSGHAVVFERDASSGEWPGLDGITLPFDFDSPVNDPNEAGNDFAEHGFGVAMDESRIAVGAPGDIPPEVLAGGPQIATGVVRAYTYTSDPVDGLSVTLTDIIGPDDLQGITDPDGSPEPLQIDDFQADARFGAAVAIDDRFLTVAAPRGSINSRINGSVTTILLADLDLDRYTLRRDVSIRPTSGAPTRFGAAVASLTDPMTGLVAAVAGWPRDESSFSAGGSAAVLVNTDVDCNGNGIPDSCDIASGFETDCYPYDKINGMRGNGIPDSCDIAAGLTSDCNGNLIPDECELRTAEIVFVIDDSGSVAGNQDAVCSIISDLKISLESDAAGDPDMHLITSELLVSDAACLPNAFASASCIRPGETVTTRFGSSIPGAPIDLETVDSCEAWAGAAAIVADRYPWRTAARVVVVVGNECAWTGTGGPACSQDDLDSAIAAATVLECRDVTFFPILVPGPVIEPIDVAIQMNIMARTSSGEAFGLASFDPADRITLVDAMTPKLEELLLLHDYAPNDSPDGIIDLCQFLDPNFDQDEVDDCNANGIDDDAEILIGIFGDELVSEADLIAPIGLLDVCQVCCEADIASEGGGGPDHVVDFTDILTVLANWDGVSTDPWTPCDGGSPMSTVDAADVDGSGLVGFNDILTVLGAWGPCYVSNPPSCPTLDFMNAPQPPQDILDCLRKANWDPVKAAPCIDALNITGSTN
ncbi:MAG: FG-GAP repeat protein [Phycisphaerales bacterium]